MDKIIISCSGFRELSLAEKYKQIIGLFTISIGDLVASSRQSIPRHRGCPQSRSGCRPRSAWSPSGYPPTCRRPSWSTWASGSTSPTRTSPRPRCPWRPSRPTWPTRSCSGSRSRRIRVGIACPPTPGCLALCWIAWELSEARRSRQAPAITLMGKNL